MKTAKTKVTIKQKKAFAAVVENGGIISKGMIEAGYSPATAHTPQKLTESEGWQELTKEYLANETVLKQHVSLLNSTKIEHMVFPLGPRGEDDENYSGANPNSEYDEDADPEADTPEAHRERTSLTDQEIIEMLAEVNCKVRRIVHANTARHVYFWAADNKARKDAIDMAYKVKGLYAPEKSVSLNLNAEVNPAQLSALEKIRDEYEQKLKASLIES